jgi:hypothetical protein
MLPARLVMRMETGLCSTARDSLYTSVSVCLRCEIINAMTHRTKTPTSRLIKAHPGSIPGGAKKNPTSSSIERTAAST